MEQIQSHPIKDIYRIREGVLIEVHKYESLGYWIGRQKLAKTVRGCKGLQVLTAPYLRKYSYKSTEHYPEGTLLLDGEPVKPITDYRDFRIEVKSSGGSVLDSFDEIMKFTNQVQEIIDSYKNAEEIN
ncbi:hypothetical protein [Bacillus gaemokensis]|uniref:Uncharacterized protein n=1 Tax=Bacillus gaemokensis TaxID=574375 RepID=A0A073KBK4_9BACI|nr:hypothetical protein [Bacillus gaemokensis]KEK23891.1 hypothetical protein BAGA_05470 [Bacillus gaemokensis]KYG38132.1 hypothetical protein AZF08_20505 [Bacillus gaemokensis]